MDDRTAATWRGAWPSSLATLLDDEWVADVVATDEFDAFYRGTSQRLARYAYGLTGDAAEAQDLTQEAYARAWRRWRSVRAHDEPEAWLRVVVTRLATDRWRRLGVRRAAAAALRPPEPAQPPSETTLLLVAALRTLPLAQRRAVVLHYLVDRSVADIANETQTSVNTVKSWLARGRAGLAAALGDLNPSTDETAGAMRGESDER
jgi:RNA polymerase sigma-70 factor, ECF subfamily